VPSRQSFRRSMSSGPCGHLNLRREAADCYVPTMMFCASRQIWPSRPVTQTPWIAGKHDTRCRLHGRAFLRPCRERQAIIDALALLLSRRAKISRHWTQSPVSGAKVPSGKS